MEGYKFYEDGWVVVLPIPCNPNANLICAKVKHSQMLSAVPLMPWMVVEKEGTVICAHCDYMAGLGEACSQIAVFLFWMQIPKQRKGLGNHFSSKYCICYSTGRSDIRDIFHEL